MGLLGGFKGKLIGKSKKKEKSGKNQVVCIKFNTFSEFDSDSVIPSCSTVNLGRNDVVRDRGMPAKPEVMTVFERQTIPEATTAIDKPVKPEAKTRFNKQVNGDVNKKELPKSATKFQKTEKAQAPKAPTPAKKASELKPEIRNNEATPVSILATQTIQFPLQVSDDDDNDGNFKIHFSTNRNHNFGDLSNGDSYNDNNEDDLSPINYSSQATSIFFGGDEEPIVMRPRKVVVNDDDLSDGSSASA